MTCEEAKDLLLAASARWKTMLVGDVAEMTDDQRLTLQAKLGISRGTPLHTIAEWRPALGR